MTAVLVLFRRRCRLLLRDKGQLLLQVSLVIIFPLLVALFAMDGIPQIKHAELSLSDSVVRHLTVVMEQANQVSRVGALVSGLVMFQVILLGLMASNNTARELIGQRMILEREKLAGLSAWEIILSSFLWMFVLCFVQSMWMTFFVKSVCAIGGDFFMQSTALLLATLAVSSQCLAVSAWATNTETASLVSVYLVGFQLPLSGVILTLPAGVSEVVRPFITSYWGWSAYVQSFSDTPLFQLVSQAADPTPVAPYALCLTMMIVQILMSVFFAWTGMRRSRWL